jgi:hypothetical protein
MTRPLGATPVTAQKLSKNYTEAIFHPILEIQNFRAAK